MPESVVHFQVRMAPTLHARLAQQAIHEKQSLNAMLVKILGAAVDAYEQDKARRSPPATGG